MYTLKRVTLVVTRKSFINYLYVLLRAIGYY